MTTRPFATLGWATAAVACALAVSSCSAGDPAPGSTSGASDDAPAGDVPNDAIPEDQVTGRGLGAATVVLDGSTYTFTSDGEPGTGECRLDDGVLEVLMQLVDVDGNSAPEGAGSLEIEIGTPDAEADFEPSVTFKAAGVNLYAGDVVVLQDAPAVTLTATYSTVSGTQAMDAIVSGIAPDGVAEFDVACTG